MPFDKDSFLKGVITGMRLPRTPGGQPPFTPVPSGVLLLTEQGEPIVEEHLHLDSDATIFTVGAWYAWGTEQMMINIENRVINGGYFYWNTGDHLELVFFSSEGISGATGGVYTGEPDGYRLRVGFGLWGNDRFAGEIHYYSVGNSPVNNYYPISTIPFVGTREELEIWLANADYHYLITE